MDPFAVDNLYGRISGERLGTQLDIPARNGAQKVEKDVYKPLKKSDDEHSLKT
jgi:hypothetical protein